VITPEIVLPFRAELGEGMNIFPDGKMRWVDLPRGKAYIWNGKENQLWKQFDHEISKVLPWLHGSVVLGQTAVLLVDSEGNEVEQIGLHEASTNLRCSDGMVLPNGELLFGILDRELTPYRGRLIHVNLKREIKTIVDKTSISNGITLLSDGVRVAWVDSPRKTIEVFDFENQGLSSPRTFAVLPDGMGLIDGMCADADGGIWAALWNGTGIAHFDFNGNLVEHIKFAAPNVTSCGFDAEDNLLITTGTATLSSEDIERFPGAGSLWSIPASQHGTTRARTFVAHF
jgi:sugar lactone lactonase YvrE